MKKNLTFLTGIVFLITILAASGCSKGKSIELNDVVIIKDSTKVKIHLKDTLIDGEKHLVMYDSNDPENVAVDSLYTWVAHGMKVIWKFDRQSGIKRIHKIGSSKEARDIFKEDARKRFLCKSFKLKIPADAKWESTEEYDIEYEVKDGNIYKIDPYLRVRPAQ